MSQQIRYSEDMRITKNFAAACAFFSFLRFTSSANDCNETIVFSVINYIQNYYSISGKAYH
jgi:hypothetical protein